MAEVAKAYFSLYLFNM